MIETKKTYIIEYTALSKEGSVLLDRKKIKAKSKATEFEALAGLERYLSKKYIDFAKLQVHDIRIAPLYDDIFGDIFKDIFGY